ncbi:hypothetical protein DFQ28_003738 [Apophysomyces sp. BC1034]|nr:hypothetical protein DFQ30_003769 [Apophysomyces sp. BC1015]KAG0178859.1 hypothetical protein DFQ29_002894 [Apophysomyces sp. BC1021]KAG0189191.1 hypothetical protein DFQ28_003738 [Apophysomyces sp. BC1034]
MLPTSEIQLPPTFANDTPENYLNALISFFESYRYLTDIHVVDFLTQNQWDLIDPTWQAALLPETDTSEEWLDSLIQLAAESTIVVDAWPSTLKSFVQKAKDLPLPRNASAGNPCIINKRILPGMTEKKIHEVELLSSVIQDVASLQGISRAVDLGAGQGYLSRTLAFEHQMNVLAVDASEIQTCGAKKFDEKATKALALVAELHHITETMTPENASSILSKWSNPEESWLVCGLHACGDLSSLMLRLFAESKELKAVVNVGCCYHFLTENSIHGFPMSQCLQNQKYRLGSTARMLACQAPSRWLDRKSESLKAFEHHFFRALLQFIMVEKGLASATSAPIIGRLNKKTDFISFPVYVQAALKRMKLPQDAISPEESEMYYDKYKGQGVDKRIAILWTVRALLAPILESIILMDRWLYLKDVISESTSPAKGVWMWPLFDHIASPRNVVMVAIK